MRVLVACEFSGIVREAFTRQGHDAWSCDLIESEIPSSKHLQLDVLSILDNEWDLMIAHPPCTHLALSGAQHFKNKRSAQLEAIQFVNRLWKSKIPRICLENPMSVLNNFIGKPNQRLHPYHFGDPYKKLTCLWLKNLPLLKKTSNLTEGEARCHNTPERKNRWKSRSRTYPGIAEAMAVQWQ